MQRTRIIFALLCSSVIAACDDSQPPTSPDLAIAAAKGGVPGRPVALVKMMDACDPETFAGVPGGCARNGGVTQEKFIEQLTRLQRAPAWKFTPGNLTIFVGDEYAATNTGGEVHTFTAVEAFGGGIVPFLNELSGLPIIAPECAALGGADFIPAGGSTAPEEANEAGDENYQCCIHPWMQATVQVRER